jgi:hypothetical protein
MDNMQGETKSQKNDTKDTPPSLVQYETNGLSFVSYNKTNKLVTALYMITDIMDKEEPLRSKLRSLGANIISDIYHLKGQASFCYKINDRISEILSFLEIASGIGIVSEMNSNIIIKEFTELRNSIIEFTSKNDQRWLEEFIKEDEKTIEDKIKISSIKGQESTRIGVQKGSTLMKALSDRIPDLAKKGNVLENSFLNKKNNNEQKKKRREEIISIIKDKSKLVVNFEGLTITDIKSSGQNLSADGMGLLAQCGEKTLQRELISMVSEGILRKTGEKRWSKYFL